MIVVTETTRIREEPEALWRRIGPFVAVGEWHPLLAKVRSEGEGLGALRQLVTRNGDVQTEKLESLDPSVHVYRYSLQQSAIPVTNYTAEFRVDGGDDGTSVVTWCARFDAPAGGEAACEQAIREFFQAGLSNMRHRLTSGLLDQEAE